VFFGDVTGSADFFDGFVGVIGDIDDPQARVHVERPHRPPHAVDRRLAVLRGDLDVLARIASVEGVSEAFAEEHRVPPVGHRPVEMQHHRGRRGPPTERRLLGE
jgi:hypothetical protein